MKTGNLKLIGLLALMVAFVLGLTGCDGLRDTPDVDPDAHGVRVNISLPDKLVEAAGEGLLPLTVEKNITIEKIVVTLDDENEEPITEEKMIGEEIKKDYEVIVKDVMAGEYDVNVKLFGWIRDENPEEVNSRELYNGKAEGLTVDPDAIVDVDVDVTPLEWESLEVNLRDSEGSGILENLEKVRLEHPTLGYYAEDQKYFDQETPAFFGEGDFGKGQRVASRWHVVFEFATGDEYIDREDWKIEILLLPTEERVIEVNIVQEGSEIIIGVDVEESPDTPENLRVEDGNLVWDSVEEADYYTVLWAEDDDPDYREPLKKVGEESYPLFGERQGYYWVRAFDAAGRSSDVDKPYHLDTEPNVFYDGNFYKTINGAIAAINPSDNPKVLVGSGTYEEDVAVNVASLTLKSVNGRDETIIEGQVGGETGALSIEESNVTIDGFTIKGEKKTVRITVPTSSVSFINNKVVTGENINEENAWSGFEVSWDQQQTDLIIHNNIFVANTTAQLVYVNKATDVQFTGNEIKGEMWVPGLVVSLQGLNGGWDISDNTFDTYSEYALLEVDEDIDMDALLTENVWPQGGEIYQNKIVNEIVNAVYNERTEVFYDEIQTAINEAESEDNLLVYPGNYDEDITIELEGLTLESVKGREAVIEENISIDAADVTLSGFELLSKINGGRNADNITLSDNLITGLNLEPNDHAFTSNHSADGVHTFRNNVIDHMLNVDNSSANYLFENNTIKGYLANVRPKENYTFKITDNEFIDGGGIAFGEGDGDRIIENNNFLENSGIWILEGVTVKTLRNYWIDGLENMVSGDGEVVGNPVDDKIQGIGADWN